MANLKVSLPGLETNDIVVFLPNGNEKSHYSSEWNIWVWI